MMYKAKQMVRVLAKGGILSPIDMLRILETVKSVGRNHVHFGSRQDLLFEVKKKYMDQVNTAFKSIHTDYEIHGLKCKKSQNIVSSYVAADISASTSWLISGNYLNILEHFKSLHTLRINIADPRQNLVPLFYGQLNFIASNFKDYWYLYIRKNEENKPERWPVLIYCDDIAKISGAIEDKWIDYEGHGLTKLFEIVQTIANYNWRNIENDLTLEITTPQDYEGFGKMHNSQNYWAGFYWRNNCYDVPFLEELCQLCLNTGISKICFTPWKSILIKELQEKDLLKWHKLLGRFGINMRHSSFELNWHIPLNDRKALKLKQFIVKEFDKVDVCVHGLTLGIRTRPEISFCSIQIERKPLISLWGLFDLFVNYRILFAKHFNANTCEYEEFAPQVSKYHLQRELQALTKKFYAQLLKTNDTHSDPVKKRQTEDITAFQCPYCLSVYDEKSGDTFRGIPENTKFALLPDTYCCPVCDTPKVEFKAISFNKLKEAV